MVAVIRETVVDGEPALAVDTEEEFDRALGSGVNVVPAIVGGRDGLAPLGRGKHGSLEDVLATDDAPDPTQEDTSDPPGWVIRRLWAWVRG